MVCEKHIVSGPGRKGEVPLQAQVVLSLRISSNVDGTYDANVAAFKKLVSPDE